MALVSPGVQVTVIDESFYTPAEPGTTPLIVVATGQDKSNAAGTGTAVGTTAANAGKAFRITSQRELVETFGVPFFEKTATGNPVHGGERNEYGLLAAYSYLGSANNAFIVRANVDLNELEGAATIPGSEPKNGAWWINTIATSFGVQEWNSATLSTGGQKFTAKTPIVLTDDDSSKIEDGSGILSDEAYRRPKGSVGSIGDYAVVFETGNTVKEFARLFYKSSGNAGAGVAAGEWVVVGSPEWHVSHPVIVGGTVNNTLTPGNTFTINGTEIIVPSGANVTAQLTALAGAINGFVAGVYATIDNSKLSIYSDGATEVEGDSTLSGRVVIAAGTGPVLTNLGISAGTYLQPKLQQSPHTSVPLFKRSDNPTTAVGYPTGSVWIKTTFPGAGSDWIVSRYDNQANTWVRFNAPLYATGHAALYFLDRTGGGLNIPVDTIFVQTNAQEHFSFMSPDDTSNVSGLDTSFETAEWRVWRRRSTGRTVVTSKAIAAGEFTPGTYKFTIKESLQGILAISNAVEVSFVANGNSEDADVIANAVNAAGLAHVQASVTENNELQLIHKTGGEIRLKDTQQTPIGDLFSAYNVYALSGTLGFYNAPLGSGDDFVASNWVPLASSNFDAKSSEPLEEPVDGQLWYNPEVGQIDIMIHNGETWVGYKFAGDSLTPASPFYTTVEAEKTDPAGPIVSATAPETQSDGTALANGDLWISTADLENFPTIYKYNGDSLEWDLVDKTDQITEDGILFADARWDDSGTSTIPATIPALLTSRFLDFDAPDPALYPKGMLLWNTRRSYGNVKRYVNNYVDTNDRNIRFATTEQNAAAGGNPMTTYATDRWVTASPNNEDGSGTFRRHAQRAVVTAALKSVIDTSEEIRDEERRNFNLIAAPGYPEVIQNLINLNIDRGITAFIIGDTPLRLTSNSTVLNNWATNAAGVTATGDDGITAFDEYMAIYYPNGFTNDLSGANAVVPASHMMLKTMALSDQVSYPWFAPAGTRRGGIVNATSVGYIDPLSGEFQTVQLNEGQRDLLYDLKINPIPFFVGVGHVAFGQKTRARNASALDRINVARLVVYLRSQLSKLARPYLFEPNDKITRDEIKGAVESLLLELVGLRAIYDFIVVCDETNNTPARIDRNELWVDLAIEPVKAVEFIYIPLRLKNTGEI